MFSFNQKTYLLLAVIILSIIFFICGILHLLIKHFLKPANSESEEIASATAFQGQLQQLFHLHDEGVDQSFIDSLPIFLYKSIIGIKDPFDCVVCLCEFGPGDKLRLLPNCSHAFHIGCIDTWLLSHSTCPLCRRSLLPEYSSDGSSRSSLNVEDDSRHEAGAKDESNFKESDLKLSLQHVKLGKFRNVGVGEEGSSSRGGGEIKERCFSMGAIEYVMNESTVLQVAITPPPSKRRTNRINEGESGRISDRCNRESFSTSKIRPESRREKGVYDDCSRRAFSFRLPKHIGDLGLDLEVGRRRQKSKLVGHGPGCVV